MTERNTNLGRPPFTSREKVEFWADKENPWHGTTRGFNTMKCRCGKCREWRNAGDRRRWKDLREEFGEPSPMPQPTPPPAEYQRPGGRVYEGWREGFEPLSDNPFPGLTTTSYTDQKGRDN